MSASALALAIATLAIDHAYRVRWRGGFESAFAVGPEGARVVPSSIAGSMITVASLVFAMTLVALTLASSQLGPRLITRFMRDRINHVVPGSFIATFLYAPLVLQTVTEGEAEPFVPHVSITVALMLTLVSLGWLVYFIHHVRRLDSGGHRDRGGLWRPQPRPRSPVSAARGEGACDPGDQAGSGRPAGPGAGVDPGAEGGYVQALGTHALLRLAREHDLVIEILRRPGQFVIAGRP